jgi:hypothetical protein
MLAGPKIQHHSDPYAQHNQARHPKHRSREAATGVLPAGNETTSCLPGTAALTVPSHGDLLSGAPGLTGRYSIPAERHPGLPATPGPAVPLLALPLPAGQIEGDRGTRAVRAGQDLHLVGYLLHDPEAGAGRGLAAQS